MGVYIQYDEGAWKWDPYLDVPKNWKDTREFPRKEKPVTEKEKFDKFNEEVIEELNKLEKRRSKKKPKTDKPKKSASPLVIECVTIPDKCPRQMRIILTQLKELGKGGIPLEEFCQKLEGVLPTKQPVEKVYKHYHREMVDKGYIRVLS